MQSFSKKIIDFIKYNNATIIIASAVFILGAGAFAAGPEVIGQKQTYLEGADNTVLLSVDLDRHDTNFKIEKIESDEKYYYVTFTYLDIDAVESAWQFVMKEKTIKVTKSLREDLGAWLAAEFTDIRDSRIKNLKIQKEEAIAAGLQKRREVTEYSGLIGKSLRLTQTIFPGYNPVKKTELPTPGNLAALTVLAEKSGGSAGQALTDNLAEVYQDYINENDPDADNIFGSGDNCPAIPNTGQEDSDKDGIGDACDLVNDERTENSGSSLDENGAGTSFVEPSADGSAPSAGTIVNSFGLEEPGEAQVIELPQNSSDPADPANSAPDELLIDSGNASDNPPQSAAE